MTVNPMAESGAGEHRLRERRRATWKLMGWGALLALGVGLTLRAVTGFHRADGVTGGGWTGWALWCALLLSILALVWYTVAYFRRIDELDLLDNLWASLIGLYAIVAAYPVWRLLYETGQARQPSAEGLWMVALGATAVAYGWRKLRR